MMEESEVIFEFLDDTSPIFMGYCANGEHEDGMRTYLVKENDTKTKI